MEMEIAFSLLLLLPTISAHGTSSLSAADLRLLLPVCGVCSYVFAWHAYFLGVVGLVSLHFTGGRPGRLVCLAVGVV